MRPARCSRSTSAGASPSAPSSTGRPARSTSHRRRRGNAAARSAPAMESAEPQAPGAQGESRKSGKPARFAVVTNKSIKQAVVEPRGEERLELAGEQLDTDASACLRREGRPRHRHLWLSRRPACCRSVSASPTTRAACSFNAPRASGGGRRPPPPPGTRTEMKPRLKEPRAKPAGAEHGRTPRQSAVSRTSSSRPRRRSTPCSPSTIGRCRTVAPFPATTASSATRVPALHRQAVSALRRPALVAPHRQGGSHPHAAAGLVRARGQPYAQLRGLAAPPSDWITSIRPPRPASPAWPSVPTCPTSWPSASLAPDERRRADRARARSQSSGAARSAGESQTDRDALLERLQADRVRAEPKPAVAAGDPPGGKLALQKHPLFLDSSFEVQDGNGCSGLLVQPRRAGWWTSARARAATCSWAR